MTEVPRGQARLVLLCGLPASGKSTLARQLADSIGGVRFDPDEWMPALGVDLFDEEFRARLESEFWALAQRLLKLGNPVILEWGFWVRSERDEKRNFARSLGIPVELRYFDVPYEELQRRVADRGADGGIPITPQLMESYRAVFQPPTDEEFRLFDPPLD